MTAATLESCRIAVFAKAPEPGQAKTRLIARLGADGAARLHARLVQHAVQTALASGAGPVGLWCAPSASHPFFQALASGPALELRSQIDGDLGRRMADAFRVVLERAGGAILIGTDCPARTAHDLTQAREALACGCDAVLGPAEDGGYHLFALRRSDPRLFAGVSWGTDRVLAQTRLRLSALGWRWHELPTRWDVDRPGDLDRLLADPMLAPLAGDAFVS
ncbi:MAG TPA: TIGR04282 family arsenosugar biosynthesis glycosyltransferase [Burkholderiales bacterium]|nr:TIGR04282 family arsenosugar biosynthesis glycosyltransferase [Burkholderiales bacterium]